MADTNAFNPAGFYGVAFEHLSDDASLSVVEGVDVLAGTVGIVAFADLAISDSPDVLAADTSIIATADLIAADVNDTLTADTLGSAVVTLALVEAADTFTAATSILIELDLTATDGGDAIIAAAELPALLALDAVEALDVLVADTAILPAQLSLATTETLDVLSATIGSIVLTVDMPLVEAADTLVFDTGVIATVSFAVADVNDTLAAASSIVANISVVALEDQDALLIDASETLVTISLDLAAGEDSDSFGMLVGFDSFYANVGAIRVAWESQAVAVPADAPEEPFIDVVGFLFGFDKFGFDNQGFFAGYGGLVVDTADPDVIRVAWEEQKLVVPGLPVGAPNRFHPFITAFNEQAFFPNAFFTGSGAFYYEDREALIVPAPEVIERLREDRKSYVAPRRRV